MVRGGAASAIRSCRGWVTALMLVPLFCCLQAPSSIAATWSATENYKLQWGALQKPASGSQNATMPRICTCIPSDLTGTGTYLYGTVDNAEFNITCSGTGCGTFTIDIQNVSPNCTGVTSIGSFTGRYNGVNLAGSPPWSGLANPGAGKLFQLGGTITYTSSVAAGSCTPTYTLVVAGNNFAETLAVAFDTSVTLTKNSDINFGSVTASNASTYRISTTGAVSTVSGTGVSLFGTKSPANITVQGSTTQGIAISVGAYTANNGVTPSNAKCAYNGGAEGSCAITTGAPGAGKTLLVGVDVAASGAQAAGTTAAPSFTITAVYQ